MFVFWGAGGKSRINKTRFNDHLSIFKRYHEVNGVESFLVVQQDLNKCLEFIEK